MGRIRNMAGVTFGQLTVLSLVRKPENTRRVYWLCRCACGREVVWSAEAIRLQVRKGVDSSCGCRKGLRRRTHGASGSRLYAVWCAMHARCGNARSTGYANYGARGIRVCAAWRSFEHFLADMGAPPSPAHSLDRIDVNGDYTPSNCRWATRKEQARNTRANRQLTANGATRTVAEWAEILGLNEAAIRTRIKRGWPVEAACTVPRAQRWSRQQDTRCYASAGFPIDIHGGE